MPTFPRFRLPNGIVVRPQSQRRFVCCRRDGSIVYRTDVLDRAINRGPSVGVYVLDTAGNRCRYYDNADPSRPGKFIWVDASVTK